MLLEVYARWIPGGDGGTERQRLAAVMASPNSSPEVPQPDAETSKSVSAKERFGRRDWTRTNDPHHVKVVL